MTSTLSLAFPASLVLASPTFWMVHQHTFGLSDALRRWAICLAVSWVTIAVVRSLAFPDAVPPRSAAASKPSGDELDVPSSLDPSREPA